MIAAMLVLLLGAPLQRDTTQACDAVHTTVQREDCLRSELTREEGLLRKEERRVRAALTRPALAEFDSSATSWRTYREHECKAVYRDYSGGSLAASELAGCQIELSKQRRLLLNRIYMVNK